jgi:hypothetical protein
MMSIAHIRGVKVIFQTSSKKTMDTHQKHENISKAIKGKGLNTKPYILGVLLMKMNMMRKGNNRCYYHITIFKEYIHKYPINTKR